MENDFFDSEVTVAVEVLRKGGIILYPTDTIWGIGCDATNALAVQKIYQLKQRPDSKSMIILIADERSLLQYVAAPDPVAFDFMQQQEQPTTIIFDHAIGLADNLTGEDGSVAIRLVKDPFCRHLVRRLQHPLVSTSANISGTPHAAHFESISDVIKNGVDHVVQWRRDDQPNTKPSRIIRWKSNGAYEVIRN
jgi:L-threonylcarbamoyladenylate synthase